MLFFNLENHQTDKIIKDLPQQLTNSISSCCLQSSLYSDGLCRPMTRVVMRPPITLYCTLLYIQVERPRRCTQSGASCCHVSTDPLEAHTHLISCSFNHRSHIQITFLISLAITVANVILDCTTQRDSN